LEVQGEPNASLSRKHGEILIHPDSYAAYLFQQGAQDSYQAKLQVCVTIHGGIKDVVLLESSGVESYDRKLEETIRSTWQYQPPDQPGCTSVTFDYRPADRPPG